jgi:hypothetical protein
MFLDPNLKSFCLYSRSSLRMLSTNDWLLVSAFFAVVRSEKTFLLSCGKTVVLFFSRRETTSPQTGLNNLMIISDIMRD